MAFVGRMNSHGNLVDSELFHKARSTVNTSSMQAQENELERVTRRTKGSRTYIKPYDAVSSPCPSTVRYVGRSASSSELNSSDGTEVSTLRYCSPRSLETESDTLTPEHGSDNSSLSGCSGRADQMVGRQQSRQMEYDAENHQQQQERGSTTSMCSWEEEEEVEDEEEQDEDGTISTYTSVDQLTFSCSVPLLDLGSDTASLQYDPQTHLNQLKMVRRSDEAYNNWLSGKRRLSLYKQQALQEERKLKKQQDELRQQLNAQRVQEWCQRKALQNTSNNSNNNNKRKSNPVKIPALSAEVAQRRLQNWELQKIQQAEQQRQRQQREALRKQREQQQRKQLAATAWQQWVKGAAQRPKPVPLNQGMNTLRGTISNIYVNPNPWVHLNESKLASK
ncbi:PREDICTED: coiled-coil domain-containing protein 34 isoform X1 [Drosophila arizonae]|uniref:Coiled-coil domain-containing protein 34 isoform X1 n=1 Tax=Drosophila arizonae TaxID=7263 RepID=A0ABM1P014_DROAR|nr:PREDICTED: coiled-coil domain-containing protein 34 isoform X1 [Drosophila arizonae]